MCVCNIKACVQNTRMCACKKNVCLRVKKCVWKCVCKKNVECWSLSGFQIWSVSRYRFKMWMKFWCDWPFNNILTTYVCSFPPWCVHVSCTSGHLVESKKTRVTQTTWDVRSSGTLASFLQIFFLRPFVPDILRFPGELSWGVCPVECAIKRLCWSGRACKWRSSLNFFSTSVCTGHTSVSRRTQLRSLSCWRRY